MSNLYYSIVLILDSIKLSFYMLGLSFFATVILPAIVAAAASLILVPIYLLIAVIWNSSFFFSWMAPPFYVLAAVCFITFVTLTAFSLVCTFKFYKPIMAASQDILSKNP